MFHLFLIILSLHLTLFTGTRTILFTLINIGTVTFLFFYFSPTYASLQKSILKWKPLSAPLTDAPSPPRWSVSPACRASNTWDEETSSTREAAAERHETICRICADKVGQSGLDQGTERWTASTTTERIRESQDVFEHPQRCCRRRWWRSWTTAATRRWARKLHFPFFCLLFFFC